MAEILLETKRVVYAFAMSKKEPEIQFIIAKDSWRMLY